MKKKDITYKLLQGFVKDKDKSVNLYIDRFLSMTNRMFKYNGLPDTIPHEELEYLLQTNGHVFVTSVNGGLYALTGGFGGVPDMYYRPTEYTVCNPFLNLSKTFNISNDGVLVKNDNRANSLYPIIGKYAVLMTDGQLSLNTASVLSRITYLISASDDKTKQSAETFMQKILDGDFSIIGENAFYKGVSLQTTGTSNTAYITQLIELMQYYKANLCNDLGLNANYNMKRERLNTGEVNMNVDVLLPYVDNMLAERQKACERINDMYGTDITVDLNTSWKSEKENLVTVTEQTQQMHEHPIDDAEVTGETSGTDETDETSGTDETDETSGTDETETETEKQKEDDTK